MISFTNTVDVAQDIDRVYGYIADLEHTPEWYWASALWQGAGDEIRRPRRC